VYIESTRPLQTKANGQVDADAIARARRACALHGTTVGDATILAFDQSCDPIEP
jgi:hypothetical protein